MLYIKENLIGMALDGQYTCLNIKCIETSSSLKNWMDLADMLSEKFSFPVDDMANNF